MQQLRIFVDLLWNELTVFFNISITVVVLELQSKTKLHVFASQCMKAIVMGGRCSAVNETPDVAAM